jgi:hypothetical protein
MPQPWAAIVAVAGVLVALGSIGAAGRWFVVRLRKLGHLADDLLGEPARPGHEARPGLMDRVKTLEERTAELKPNGGGSIKDAVTRIDRRLAAVERIVVPDQPLPDRRKKKRKKRED